MNDCRYIYDVILIYKNDIKYKQIITDAELINVDDVKPKLMSEEMDELEDIVINMVWDWENSWRYAYNIKLIYANKIISENIMSNNGILNNEELKKELTNEQLIGLLDIKLCNIYDCDNRSYNVFNEK